MVVRESAPRITPWEKVMAMLHREKIRQDVGEGESLEAFDEMRGAYIEVPRLVVPISACIIIKTWVWERT